MELLSSEVIIIGMGISGISAAISCSQKGVNTLCIEANSNIGGTLIKSNIFGICGAYKIGSNRPIITGDKGVRFWLKKLKGAPKKIGRLWVFRFKNHVFNQCIYETVSSLKNLKILTSTPIKPGLKLKAKVFIDCSTNATLTRLSNRETIDPIKTAPGLNVIFKNIDLSKLSVGTIDIMKMLLSIDSSCTLRLYPQLELDGEIPATVNLTPYNPEINQTQKLLLYSKAKKYLYNAFNYLTRHHAAFKNAHIYKIGENIGFRSGRTIKGLSCLSEQDIIKGRVKKGITCYWPIEFWDSAYGPKIIFPHLGSYNIPFKCLFTKGIKPYILAAGANISATPIAQSSCRVLASCMDTGYYAGEIAAELAQKEPFYTISL